MTGLTKLVFLHLYAALTKYFFVESKIFLSRQQMYFVRIIEKDGLLYARNQNRYRTGSIPQKYYKSNRIFRFNTFSMIAFNIKYKSTLKAFGPGKIGNMEAPVSISLFPFLV